MPERDASLVYHAGALGDFITTLPAFGAWRRQHPREEIVLMGTPTFAGLALPGVFDETWDAGARQFAPLFSPSGPAALLSARLARFRSALLFATDASPIEMHLASCGVPTIVRQSPFPSQRSPIVDYHLSLFPGLPFTSADRCPRVRTDHPEASDVSTVTVALHAGSGSRAKNWPVERFAAIADRLGSEGFDVAWIQGPAEEGMRAPAGHAVWRGLSLATLSGRLARCRMYVGNDSGVTHLAAASGCPTIALFGPSDHHVWAPRGRVTRIVESDDGRIEGIAVDDVLREVRSLLGG